MAKASRYNIRNVPVVGDRVLVIGWGDEGCDERAIVAGLARDIDRVVAVIIPVRDHTGKFTIPVNEMRPSLFSSEEWEFEGQSWPSMMIS